MKYVVPVKWIMYSYVEVDAESAQEAFWIVDDHKFDTDMLYERMNEGDFVFLNSEISADEQDVVTDEDGKEYVFNELGLCVTESEDSEEWVIEYEE